MLTLKTSDVPTSPIAPDIIDATKDTIDSIEDKSKNELKNEEIIDSIDDDDRKKLLNQQQNVVLWNDVQKEIMNNPKYVNTKDALLNHPSIQKLFQNLSSGNVQTVQKMIEDAGIEGSAVLMNSNETSRLNLNNITRYVDRLNRTIIQQMQNSANAAQNNLLPLASLKWTTKVEKINKLSSKFPVNGIIDFASKFLNDILLWNGQKGAEDNKSNQAVTEIQSAVGQGFEQEANSALRGIQQMDPVLDRDKAEKVLIYIYENWLSPIVKGNINSMEQNNSPQDRTVHLSDQVLNNKLVKTAADQFGQQYLLYGPTEKRICPKLRGKGMSDVVSEYTCRHHCLDGIVIDDNKTICGEALWRANAMDKFSREYVNENGETVGGYLNKRFEINRNVPEENKMRLKPGELRKDRPPAWGNLESRLQDMRNKEGEKRGYNPVNTGKPFNWSEDVDRNNFQTSQSERKAVNETHGNEQPVEKKAFNLKMHKNSQYGGNIPEHTPPKDFEHEIDDVVSPHPIHEEQDNVDTEYDKESLAYSLLNWHGGGGSALYQIGSAWIAGHDVGHDVLMDGVNELSEILKTPGEFSYEEDFEEVQSLKNKLLSEASKINDANRSLASAKHDIKTAGYQCKMCGGPCFELGSLGRRKHFRCRNCGMDFSKEIISHKKCKICNKRYKDRQLKDGVCPNCSDTPVPPTDIIPNDIQKDNIIANNNSFNLKKHSQNWRGPVGPDNPKSDDLGLSEDYRLDIDDVDGNKEPASDSIPVSLDEFNLIFGPIDDGRSTKGKYYDFFFNILKEQIPNFDAFNFEWSTHRDELPTIDVWCRPPCPNFGEALECVTYALDQLRKTVAKSEPDFYNKFSESRFNLNEFIKTHASKDATFTYNDSEYRVNPFAVCNKSTGGKLENPEKYESCVQKVKEENKIPSSPKKKR